VLRLLKFIIEGCLYSVNPLPAFPMLSAAKHTEWSVIQVFYLMIHMHIQGYGTHASGVLNRVESSSNI